MKKIILFSLILVLCILLTGCTITKDSINTDDFKVVSFKVLSKGKNVIIIKMTLLGLRRNFSIKSLGIVALI